MKHKKSSFCWPRLQPTAVALATLAALVQPAAWAAPLDLSKSPAGATGKAPAPNVILSLDDSGSMRLATGNGDSTSRMVRLKEALLVTFTQNNPDVADGKIRLAWQMFNDCKGFPSSTGRCDYRNDMKILQGRDNDPNSHRGFFLKWVRTMTPGGNTPTNAVMKKAGDYLSKDIADSANPWLTKPGDLSSGYLPCRRSYHILMTDGEWNDHTLVGRRTNQRWVLPDGKVYYPDTDQTRIYNSKKLQPMIGDAAFSYWAQDLQRAIPNQTTPQMRVTAPEVVTGVAYGRTVSVTLDPYWNPKNDPSTWQNMVTYTIGFGDAANMQGKRPRWDSVSNDMFSTDTSRSDYVALITGAKTWAQGFDTESDMWHIALNSRGRFIPARTAQDLKKAFGTILTQIAVENVQPLSGFVATSASYSRDGVEFFHTGYDTGKNWKGYVSAQKLSTDGNLQGRGAWNGKTTADILDALADNLMVSSRLIFTHNGARPTTFEWNNLSDSQKTALRTVRTQVASEQVAQQRLNYIRGVRAGEGTTFRKRSSRQGDIVNSALWYTGAPAASHAFGDYATFADRRDGRDAMIYVGGNDGMFHGFSAKTGMEKMAYIPLGVYPKLALLTHQDYDLNHQYYVDGSPLVADVLIGRDWRSLAIGTLAGGGKGYFILDVTDPSAFSATNAAAIVKKDLTDGSNADIGHIYGEPLTEEGNPQMPVQVVRTNDNRWAYLTGNGVNSANERPVLVVQYLDGAGEIKLIAAATSGENAQGNGLSTPRPLDVNGDGKVDFVYAGDLRGNLWKFDLSSADAGNWGVAKFGGAAQPMFVATDASNRRQPITSAPLVRANDAVGGLMVAFGTGRLMTDGDRSDAAGQTFYALLDKTRYAKEGDGVKIDTGVDNPAVTGRSQLKSRVFNTNSTSGSGTSRDIKFWAQASSGNDEVQYQSSDRGWYFDLPESRERVIQSPEFFDGSKIIELKSMVPSNTSSGASGGEESCGGSVGTSQGYRTLINIETGYGPASNVMDVNGDGKFNSDDLLVNNKIASRSTASTVELKVRGQGVQKRVIGADGKGPEYDTDGSRVLLRPNWRQLQ